MFVVLGIRLANFIALGRPLQYQDLTVLLMLSVESSNGTIAGTTNSLTGQLLAMVACTTEITPSIVRTALANCRIASLRSWIKGKFGNSLHYTRSLELTPTPADLNLRKQKPVAIPVF